MKYKTIEEALRSRNNLIGFLHISEINEINEIFVNYDVNHANFEDICSVFLNKIKNKEITKKNIQIVFDILISSNKSFKDNTHRYIGETKSIYEYDFDAKDYKFLKQGSYEEFKALNKLI